MAIPEKPGLTPAPDDQDEAAFALLEALVAALQAQVAATLADATFALWHHRSQLDGMTMDVARNQVSHEFSYWREQLKA